MIKHDRGDVSVVTSCTKCPHWKAFSWGMEEAERREIAHNMLVHEMNRSRASDAVRKRRERAQTPARHAG